MRMPPFLIITQKLFTHSEHKTSCWEGGGSGKADVIGNPNPDQLLIVMPLFIKCPPATLSGPSLEYLLLSLLGLSQRLPSLAWLLPLSSHVSSDTFPFSPFLSKMTDSSCLTRSWQLPARPLTLPGIFKGWTFPSMSSYALDKNLHTGIYYYC